MQYVYTVVVETTSPFPESAALEHDDEVVSDFATVIRTVGEYMFDNVIVTSRPTLRDN